ncbi:protein of unknown function [Hyphomicrobium sp. 1Nfss2.1]
MPVALEVMKTIEGCLPRCKAVCIRLDQPLQDQQFSDKTDRLRSGQPVPPVAQKLAPRIKTREKLSEGCVLIRLGRCRDHIGADGREEVTSGGVFE